MIKKQKIMIIDNQKYMYCKLCENYYPLNEKFFYRNKSSIHGYCYCCKKCWLNKYGMKNGVKKEKYNMFLIMDEWEKEEYYERQKKIKYMQEYNLLRLPINYKIISTYK